MNLNALEDLLQGKDFGESIAIADSKIKELKPLVDAAGGIQKIKQKEQEAKSKVGIAEKALQEARAEAEQILTQANEKAKEILQSANEDSENQKILLHQKFKEASVLETAIKKEKVELSKAQVKVKKDKEAVEKEWVKIRLEQSEIARKKAILAQLG